mmetsp:Transcript_42201/g.135010  ORF Transcript_42201/g.135010 Transcript_42201/m.135010 type:complete len:363 (+) Transcript_42201:831-1919(+)
MIVISNNLISQQQHEQRAPLERRDGLEDLVDQVNDRDESARLVQVRVRILLLEELVRVGGVRHVPLGRAGLLLVHAVERLQRLARGLAGAVGCARCVEECHALGRAFGEIPRVPVLDRPPGDEVHLEVRGPNYRHIAWKGLPRKLPHNPRRVPVDHHNRVDPRLGILDRIPNEVVVVVRFPPLQADERALVLDVLGIGKGARAHPRGPLDILGNPPHRLFHCGARDAHKVRALLGRRQAVHVDVFGLPCHRSDRAPRGAGLGCAARPSGRGGQAYALEERCAGMDSVDSVVPDSSRGLRPEGAGCRAQRGHHTSDHCSQQRRAGEGRGRGGGVLLRQQHIFVVSTFVGVSHRPLACPSPALV